MTRDEALDELDANLPAGILASLVHEEGLWEVTLVTVGFCRSWTGANPAEVVRQSLAAADLWRADRTPRRRSAATAPPRLSAPTTADAARRRRAKDAG